MSSLVIKKINSWSRFSNTPFTSNFSSDAEIAEALAQPTLYNPLALPSGTSSADLPATQTIRITKLSLLEVATTDLIIYTYLYSTWGA